MPARLVLLDNTVLSNFALVSRPDLIIDLWGSSSATTPEVMREYEAGIAGRGLRSGIWDTLTLLALGPVERDFAGRLPSKLGSGERSCLAVAVHRNYLFACDDAEARREAQRLGLAVTGSIGILVLSVRQARLGLADANSLLEEMIVHGYRSPVATLVDLV